MAVAQLTDLSDDELLSRLESICLEGHSLTARLLVYLIEVEKRRLDLRAACTSLFDFCIRKLGMSEGAAFRRITAARLVRRFPSLLGRIERGEIHLSTLVLMRPHLTEANIDELSEAVSGKRHREIEAFLARVGPAGDVPSTILEVSALQRRAPSNDVGPPGDAAAPKPEPKPPPIRQRIAALPDTRYRVHLTASAELRDKLERARDLMLHRNPTGDLAVVVERALDMLLAKLEKERLGKTSRPQRSGRASTTGRVRRAVRREVFERDGERCTFVGENGERCPLRALLELDHIESRALGGPDDADNLRVRCRAHNRLHAEEVFGKEHIASAIDFRQRKSPGVMSGSESTGATKSEGGSGSASTSTSTSSSGSEGESLNDGIDLALRGLVRMGFGKSEARRALAKVAARRVDKAPALPVQELVREALVVLA